MANERTETVPKALVTAFWLNFVWINFSEVARYFLIVRPLLHEAFPGQEDIGAMSVSIFAIWGLWDLILICAATGFYWLWLNRFGNQTRQVIAAGSAFTVSVFGLIWLGIANMGLAPFNLAVAALPLAWIEQLIACAIVAWAIKRH